MGMLRTDPITIGLIFFTKEIKANRRENKSADDINNMMLVG